MNELLTPPEAAAYMRTTAGTLAQYRFRKEGPAFVKLGKKVLYKKSDLDNWVEENTHGTTQQKRTVALSVPTRGPRVQRKHRLGGHRTKSQKRSEAETTARALLTDGKPIKGKAMLDGHGINSTAREVVLGI